MKTKGVIKEIILASNGCCYLVFAKRKKKFDTNAQKTKTIGCKLAIFVPKSISDKIVINKEYKVGDNVLVVFTIDSIERIYNGSIFFHNNLVTKSIEKIEIIKNTQTEYDERFVEETQKELF